MRRIRLALTLVSTVAFVVVSAGLITFIVLSERGVTYGLDTLPELRYADAPAVGANTFLHREADPAKIARELQLLRSAGIGLIRQEFQWIEIEPYAKGEHVDTHGGDAWAKYDRMVDLAEHLDIEIMARLDRPPAWATPGFDPHANPSIQMPPTDPTDFADFAATVAKRYRGRIRFFQVWNEPNLLGEWGGRPPDPAAYLAMLREVGTAIREVNPQAVIVLAGLAPTIETGPDNLSDLLFLETLYQLGAKGAFDVASTMSYGLFTGPRDLRIGAERTNLPRAVLWRELMVAYGDSGTPIWASEYGWMSLPDGWVGNQGIWGNHSPAEQAAWTVDGIRRAREQWPWLPTVIIWASRWPHDPHPHDPNPLFALLAKDLTPRQPLVEIEQTYATAPTAGVGLHQETHKAFTFYGPWPRIPSNWASLLLHRETGQAGARVELRFDSDSVGLLTRRGPDMGQVRVRIDGHPGLADALPQNSSGEAILNLYAPEVASLIRIPIASRLPEGTHVLELTVMAERDPQSTGGLVIVDGALVGNSRSIWPYLALGSVWIIVIGAATFVLGRRYKCRGVRWASITATLDKRVPSGTLAGEVIAGSLAATFVLLPDGTPNSVWTLMRLGIAVALGALALARPLHVAVITVAAIPFVGVIARTGVFDRPVGETLIIVVVLAWILRMLWRRDLPPVRSVWLWLAIAIIGVGITTTSFADYPKVAWRDLRTVIVEPALLFLALFSLVRNRSDAHRIGVALVIGAIISAVVALALVPADTVVTGVGPPRLRGLFGSPNNLAMILERILPIAVGFALIGLTKPRRLLGWLTVTLLVTVLVLTFSRGAWIGGLVGLTVALIPVLRRTPRLLRTAAPIIIACLGLAAIVTAGGDHPATFIRASDAAAMARPLLWDSAWQMIRDHLLLGVGPDNFLYHYPDYIHPEAWAEPHISHAHNIVLDTWLTLGAFGVFVLLILAASYVRTWKKAHRSVDADGQTIVYGLGGSMTAILLHGMVDGSIFLPELAATFWVVIALTIAIARPSGRVAQGECAASQGRA